MAKHHAVGDSSKLRTWLVGALAQDKQLRGLGLWVKTATFWGNAWGTISRNQGPKETARGVQWGRSPFSLQDQFLMAVPSSLLLSPSHPLLSYAAGSPLPQPISFSASPSSACILSRICHPISRGPKTRRLPSCFHLLFTALKLYYCACAWAALKRARVS